MLRLFIDNLTQRPPPAPTPVLDDDISTTNDTRKIVDINFSVKQFRCKQKGTHTSFVCKTLLTARRYLVQVCLMMRACTDLVACRVKATIQARKL